MKNSPPFLTLKIIFTISLLSYILYQYIDFSNLYNLFDSLNYTFIWIILLISFANRILLAYQMTLCLVPFEIYIKTYNIFKVHLISSFYGLILPGKIVSTGVIWYLISKENGKRAQVASIMIYLKAMNLITVIPFAMVGIYFEPLLVNHNIHLYIIIFGFLLTIIILPFFWDKFAIFLEWIIHHILKYFPSKRLSQRILAANQNLWNSIKVNRDWSFSFIARIVVLSFITQVMGVVFVYFAMAMVNIHLPLYVSTWIFALLVIVHNLPVTIAGLGLREFSLIIVLKELYSIPPESALLLSTIYLFIAVFFGILGGYYTIALKKVETEQNHATLGNFQK